MRRENLSLYIEDGGAPCRPLYLEDVLEDTVGAFSGWTLL